MKVDKGNDLSTIVVKEEHKRKAVEFRFYYILENAELLEPIHETHRQVREERVSKTKKLKNKYLQVGSFRKEIEASRMKDKLASLKIESTIEKNKIGKVIWNRVVIGSFNSSSEIKLLREKLKQYGIDSIVFRKLTLGAKK